MVRVFRGKDACLVVTKGEDITPPVTIARAQSASCEISTALETLYEIGSAMPAEIEMGNVEITGTIEGVVLADVEEGQLSSLIDLGLATSEHGVVSLKAPFNLEFRASNIPGSPVIKLLDCRTETGTLDFPQDGWIAESIDFRAKRIVKSTM